jgi:hypothetical protein
LYEGYGYETSSSSSSSGKTNRNVQIFARDTLLPTITPSTSSPIDTDMAYTDSFRGGSSSPYDSPSPNSPPPSSYGSAPLYNEAAWSTYDQNGPYHPSESLPYHPESAGCMNGPYDTVSTYGSSSSSGSSDGQGHSNYYPSIYSSEPHRDQHSAYGQSQSYSQPSYSAMGPGYSNSAHSYQQDGNMGGTYGYQGIRKTFVKGKTWEEKKSLVQGMSAFGHLPGTLLSLSLYAPLLALWTT